MPGEMRVIDRRHEPIPMDIARVIEVIETSTLRRGKGTDESPIRIVRQYWSLDGELLAEHDPCPDKEFCGITGFS
jgi:hypothetical protein